VRWAWLALAAALAACSPARGVPILLWHSVGEGAPHDPQDVSPDEFDAELRLLESFGATPITLGELLDARAGHGKLPERPVVLTFDDGRLSLRDQALPLLTKHHMRAELFLVADYLAEDVAHRRYVTEESGTHPYLTATEAAALQQSGAFVLESHSVSHRDLRRLPEDQQRAEVVQSREQLRRRFGAPIDFFAYPFGAFSSTTRDLVEGAGYRGALTVQKGLGSKYGMLRVSMYRGDLQRLRGILEREFGAPKQNVLAN
jgi:peptidoglycan/xylan/chitin deacetylase (PgdA/CDA1 family)